MFSVPVILPGKVPAGFQPAVHGSYSVSFGKGTGVSLFTNSGPFRKDLRNLFSQPAKFLLRKLPVQGPDSVSFQERITEFPLMTHLFPSQNTDSSGFHLRHFLSFSPSAFRNISRNFCRQLTEIQRRTHGDPSSFSRSSFLKYR